MGIHRVRWPSARGSLDLGPPIGILRLSLFTRPGFCFNSLLDWYLRESTRLFLSLQESSGKKKKVKDGYSHDDALTELEAKRTWTHLDFGGVR